MQHKYVDIRKSSKNNDEIWRFAKQDILDLQQVLEEKLYLYMKNRGEKK